MRPPRPTLADFDPDTPTRPWSTPVTSPATPLTWTERAAASPRGGDGLAYWLGLPLRWAYQAAHNGHGVLCVLDITRWRPLPAGLIGPEHPWVTGLHPATGRPVWHENVLYRSPRGPSDGDLPAGDEGGTRTCRFLAERAGESAVMPGVPQGPGRRMPHGINYIHGSSHYNSGILVFTDFEDGFAHLTDRRFRAEVRRFVRRERREVLILFRRRRYTPREFAYFCCGVRTL